MCQTHKRTGFVTKALWLFWNSFGVSSLELHLSVMQLSMSYKLVLDRIHGLTLREINNLGSGDEKTKKQKNNKKKTFFR